MQSEDVPLRAVIALLLVVASCGILGCDGVEPDHAPPATPGIERPAWFTEITETSGVDFRHESGACSRHHDEKPRRVAN